jgi:hypothetical protein
MKTRKQIEKELLQKMRRVELWEKFGYLQTAESGA